MTLLHVFVLLLFFTSRSDAFSLLRPTPLVTTTRSTKSQSGQQSFTERRQITVRTPSVVPLIDQLLPTTTTTVPLITDRRVSLFKIKPKKDKKPCRLDLDDQGCLRLDQSTKVLLDGLNPLIWSASRPDSGETNCLFLQTSYSNELAEHQNALGNLVSCQRLLACSRTYTLFGEKGSDPNCHIPK